MSGCFNSETVCEHGMILKFGCMLCERNEDASPLVQQIQILSEGYYNLEKRVEELERINGMEL